jgi:glycosyltransferase involved in cell wall biosynthesis
LRVRILIDYRPALRQRTGVGEYVHELATALAASRQADETLTLFSSSWKDRLEHDPVPGVLTIDRRVPVRLLNFAWHRLQGPPIESLTGKTFDVVQSAHPLPIPSRTAARIVTVHDLDFLDHPERTRAEIRRDYASLAPQAVRAADHVLVNSGQTASEVEHRFGVPADRITICSPGAPPWPRRADEPADGYLLFFGTLEPRKNVGLLLDAYGRLLATEPRPPRLVLAGGTPPEAAALLARVAAAPFAGHVEVRGYVAPERRWDLYAGALALVMPSHTEGFGIPALEAMTVGVPVIAADRGALPEVVGDAGMLIDPRDPVALAGCLRDVLSNRALRNRLRAAGWYRAGRFSWIESARRTRAAWMQAIEHRSRRG